MTASEIEDPELARYLNRSYWEQKQQEDHRDKENHRDKEDDKVTAAIVYPSAPTTSVSSLSNTLKTTEVNF